MSEVLKYRKIEGHRTQIEEILTDVQLEDIVDIVSNPSDPIDGEKDEQYLLYWGSQKDSNNLYIKENYGERCALVLDYDDSVGFDEFHARYNGKFQYYMHSSWNDIVKGVDKFRVIIPLAETFWMSRALEAVLLHVFDGVDSTCFGNRGFFMPVKRPNYRYAISNGEILSIHKFDSLVQKEIEESNKRQLEKEEKNAKLREAYKNQEYNEEKHKENILAKIQNDTLDKIAWNCDGQGRYSVLFKTIKYLKQLTVPKFFPDEIDMFIEQYLRHLSRQNQVNLRKIIDAD